MKMLFITSRLPYPPDRGDKVRTFFLLKELSIKYEIVLLSYIESEDDRKYIQTLQSYCREIILIHHSKLRHILQCAKGLINKLPFQVNYYDFLSTKKLISKIIAEKKIDHIYTHLIRMANMTKDFKCYKILDYTDAISMEYERSLPHRKSLPAKIFFSWEAKRSKRFEKTIIKTFEEAWFISDEDITYLDFRENKKVKKVPNPVVIGDYKKDYSLHNRIIFVGNMSVPHNIFAVQFITNHIMPKLLAKKQLNFCIIGASPTKEVQNLENKNNTKVLGFVPDLVRELKNSDIFVAPMFFSAGVQNKVLEAMAVGLPVITTKNVALSLNAEHNKEIKIADSADEFVEGILEFINNSHLRTTIGNCGYKLIKDQFSINIIRKIIGIPK